MTTETRHFPHVPFLAGLLDRLAERARQCEKRREYKSLLELDDQILRDVGVTRDEVRRHARLPAGPSRLLTLERNHLPF